MTALPAGPSNNQDLRVRLRTLELSEEQLLSEYLAKQNLQQYDLTPRGKHYLINKVVMVVGGGGSIGAELVMQLQALDPGVRQIVLVDNNENGVYRMKRKLRDSAFGVPVELLIGDVRNEQRLRTIFAEREPNVVFHYANYKSLVLGNTSPGEFVKVNVGGTRTILRVSCEFPSVERFIYVSSDKAQDPSQSYGRTKWLAEVLVQTASLRAPDKCFGSIRYCNVLDAAGSFAIPTFREQILAGRPLTVRRINGEVPRRYFIPRAFAAKLALKTGEICRGGEAYTLNKKQITPLAIDELISIMAAKLQIPKPDVGYEDGERGEKLREELGSGPEVAETPLVQIPSSRPSEPLVRELVDLLLAVADNTQADPDTETLLEEIVENASILFTDSGKAPTVPPQPGLALALRREELFAKLSSVPCLSNPRDVSYAPVVDAGTALRLSLKLDISRYTWAFRRQDESRIAALGTRISAVIHHAEGLEPCISEITAIKDWHLVEEQGGYVSTVLEVTFTPRRPGDYRGIDFLVDGYTASGVELSECELVVTDETNVTAENPDAPEAKDCPQACGGQDLVIVSGPPGVGRRTLLRILRERYKSDPQKPCQIQISTEGGEPEVVDSRACCRWTTCRADPRECLGKCALCYVLASARQGLVLKDAYPRATTVLLLPLTEGDIRRRLGGVQAEYQDRCGVIRQELRYRLGLLGLRDEAANDRLDGLRSELAIADRFDLVMPNPRWRPSVARDALVGLVESKRMIRRAMDIVTDNKDDSHEEFLSRYDPSYIWTFVEGMLGFVNDCHDTLQKARGLKFIADAAEVAARRGLVFGNRFRVQYESALAAYYGRMAQETLRSLKPGLAGAELHTPNALLDGGVVYEAPVRIDLAHGGGSDLFAICADRGGTAVNIAVAVHGRRPVRVMVRRLTEAKIVLRSGEDKAEIEPDLHAVDYADPREPWRVFKAALLLSGVGGAVRRIGGGLEIACEVELPSNPGLGVGGIFGAVLLSSLYALSDQQIDRTNVIKEALYMEQLLGFSGGWQNVVGGVEGGIKVVSSSAGLAPAPSVIRRLDQDADVSSGAIEALKRRMVLCYIGPGANSRPLLLKLVGDYLSRKPEALDARGEMERLTNQVIRHLSSGNLDELGRDLGRIWQKHKVLVPEASSRGIELLLGETRDLVVGGKPCGAGGGGCAILIATEGKEQELRGRLTALFQGRKEFADHQAAILDYEIDDQGLSRGAPRQDAGRGQGQKPKG